MSQLFRQRILPVALLVLAALFLAGCQTAQPDWQSRVGKFNYDQAVIELGPPARSTKLENGTLVAEWQLAGPRSSFSFGIGTGGMVGRSTAVGVGQTVTTTGGAQFLQLTFAPDGTLIGQKQLRR